MKPKASVAAALLLLLACLQAVASDLDTRRLQIELAGGGDTRAVLGDLIEDKPVILHFWATWCAPCRKELPELATFIETLDDPSRVILISVDTKDYSKVSKFLNEDLQLDLHTWRTTDPATGSLFRIFGYPSTIFMGGSGAIAETLSGPVEWSDPEKAASIGAFVQ